MTKDADSREFQHTFQLRAYTSKQGFAELEKVLRQQCWLYNQALEMRIKAWEIGGVSVSFYDQCKWLTGMRFTHQFTKYDRMDTLARRVQCGTLKRLDKAFEGFFRRIKAGQKAGFPRFKPAQRWHTIEVDSPKYEKGWLSFSPDRAKPRVTLTVKGLPPLEMKTTKARCLLFQELVGAKKWTDLRVAKKGRRITVNLTFQVAKEGLAPTGKVMGMNRGVVRKATLHSASAGVQGTTLREGSSCWWRQHFGTYIRSVSGSHAMVDLEGLGQMVVPMYDLETPMQRLQPKNAPVVIPPAMSNRKRKKRLQRKVSRAVKGSNSRRKKVAVYANICDREKIRHRNETHRLTSQIIKDFDTIAIEDFDIVRMTASISGTVDNPGKGVERKSDLNREIMEQRWGQIHQQLTYKAAWAGRQLLVVSPAFITQECSRCGTNQEGPYPERQYRCARCKLVIDQDENAAINILRRGLSSAGLEHRPGMPQGVSQPAMPVHT